MDETDKYYEDQDKIRLACSYVFVGVCIMCLVSLVIGYFLLRG